jgi:hypothetical protein
MFHIVEIKIVLIKILKSNVFVRFADTVRFKCSVTSLPACLTPLFISFSLRILESPDTVGLDRRDMQRNRKANGRYQSGGHRHKAAT